MGEKIKRAPIFMILAVVFLLFISHPAQALSLSIESFDNPNPIKGTIVSTNAKMKVNSNEKVTLDKEVILTVDKIVFCSINLDGSDGDCQEGANISVFLSENSSFYSYGYEEEFEFNISIDTSSFEEGSHLVEIYFENNEEIYTAQTRINIKTESKDGTKAVYKVIKDQEILLKPPVFTTSENLSNHSKVIYLSDVSNETMHSLKKNIDVRFAVIFLIFDAMVLSVIDLATYKRKNKMRFNVV